MPPLDPYAGYTDTGLTGRYLKTAAVAFDPNTGAPYISLTFNSDGATLFDTITKNNVGKTLAIFLDNQIISSPTIQTEISGGNAVINGSFTPAQAKALADSLSYGALPVPIHLISSQLIGPSLGVQAMHDGVKAGVIGFIIIGLFLLFWYRLPGLVAIVALSLYVAFTLFVFKILHVTISAAAIAGFIATARLDRARSVDGQLAGHLPPPGEWSVKIGQRRFTVALSSNEITVDGTLVDLALEYTPGDRMVHAEIGDEPLSVKIEPTRNGLKLTTRGAIHKVEILPAGLAYLAEHMIEKVPPDLSRFLICPMPGLLVALHVGEGDKVEAGQPLAVVEAMKMENILRAEKSATVKKVNAKAGESLAVDAIILELE